MPTESFQGDGVADWKPYQDMAIEISLPSSRLKVVLVGRTGASTVKRKGVSGSIASYPLKRIVL